MARAKRAQPSDNSESDGDKPVFDKGDGPALYEGAVDPNQIGSCGTGGQGESGSSAEAAPKAKRTRKTGGKGRKAGSKVSIRADHITLLLMTVNNGLAARFKTPVFFLEQSEAEELTPPVQAVLQHYGLDDMVASWGPWGALAYAVGVVYMPKILTAFGLAKGETPQPAQDGAVSREAREIPSFAPPGSDALMGQLSAGF